MDEEQKKVDEAWKENITKDTQDQEAGSEGAGAPQDQEANFSFFVTSLAVQASIALGVMPNPMTQKVEQNLQHAKLIIDTLGILKEKTRGNLTTEEDSLLDNMLYELRTHYIAKMQGGSNG